MPKAVALDRDAGVDGGLAGRVLAGAGGQDLAHDDLVHLLGLHPGALERGLDGDRCRAHGPDRLAKAPLKLPTGVRAAETMTISVMTGSPP